MERSIPEFVRGATNIDILFYIPHKIERQSRRMRQSARRL